MKIQMNNSQLIITRYENSHGDSTELFQEILCVSEEVGLDKALSILECCVTEKRLAWAKSHLGEMKQTENRVLDGYRWFCEKYLGVSIPEDNFPIQPIKDQKLYLYLTSKSSSKPDRFEGALSYQ